MKNVTIQELGQGKPNYSPNCLDLGSTTSNATVQGPEWMQGIIIVPGFTSGTRSKEDARCTAYNFFGDASCVRDHFVPPPPPGPALSGAQMMMMRRRGVGLEVGK